MSLLNPTRVLRSSLLPLAAIVAAQVGRAQMKSPPSEIVRDSYDSGFVANRSGARAVVASYVAEVPGARWLRLEFEEIRLAGGRATGDASVLRLTSAFDGAIQLLDAAAAREWRNASAYFNGDAVLVELIAGAGATENRVVLEQVVVGVAPVAEVSQCGATDDRVPSADRRVARVMPNGCTAWLIEDCNHCLLTAGHCAPGMATIEFNVPPSLSDGTVQHPRPQDQYAIDFASTQRSLSTDIGNDWAYFGCFPNSTSGLTAYSAQGAAYTVEPPPPFDPAAPVRVTGYGWDIGDASQTQQTDVGPWVAHVGTTLQYQVDTQPGNSGSPIIHATSGVAIGIHANGTCTTGLGANQGTAANHAALQVAFANPLGICRAAPCAASGTPYCAGDGSATACPCANAGTTGRGCNNSASTGGGWLAAGGDATVSADTLVLYATGLLPHATAIFYQGDLPKNGRLGVVLGDGLSCVGGNLIRFGVRTASAGNASWGAGVPGAGPISVQGAIPAAGATRHYQAYYRDPASFCSRQTFNLTNGLTVVWTP
jgi:hypothetical protein